MEALHVFHMNGGEGDTSYAKNCTIQSKVLSITRPYVEEAIQDYLSKDFSADTITIAELGCSSGPTALEAVTTIMDVVESRRQRVKLMVYLVDLPGNDFNKVFTFIPSLQKRLKEEKGVDFGPCFIAGLPGNFYGRLLPNKSLQFIHCSSSLNWLSQAPLGLEGKDDPKMLNKGKVYLSVTSPSHVIDAYKSQFQKDFTTFLKCRSDEMVIGGRMVLSFMGRRSIDHTFEEDYYPMEFIAQALITMVSQGRLKEEKVDSFNAPFYAPHLEEVKKLIEEKSSFYIDRFEAIEVEWAGGRKSEGDFNSSKPRLTRGATIAKMQRAVLESMLEHHFGGDIIDELFLRYAKTWEDHLLYNESPTFINLVISLTRMMTMNMLQVFHMNKGGGETSYAKNCTIQSKILSITKPFVEAAMHDYLSTDNIPWDTITIAELGCSSGPTALDAVTTIMDVVESRQRMAKFMVYLVDLPSNDFNEVFTFIPSLQKRVNEEKGVDFGPCFVAGLPGNFYERLLPNHSLHFVHSSSSLHWLSQVPMGLDGKDGPKNKGKIYLSVTSPSHVIDAYKSQFRKDFLSFLKCRSQEMVLGGRMVLSFMGKRSSISNYEEDYFPLELIARALMTMVSEGLLEEEKVDIFNVPFYAPSLEEVKQLIDEEKSFKGDHFAAIEVEWDGGSGISKEFHSYKGRLTRGEIISKMHRAVLESMLEHHFGGDIMDELFLRYAKIWDAHLLLNENSKLTALVISLIRM